MGRDSGATFWDKGTEVPSLSQNQIVAMGRDRPRQSVKIRDGTQDWTITIFSVKIRDGTRNHYFSPLISCFRIFFLFWTIFFLF
jgi:hypothetical protein